MVKIIDMKTSSSDMPNSSKKLYLSALSFCAKILILSYTIPVLAINDDEFDPIELPGGGGNPNNAPAAPIDDWVIAVLGISVVVMFFYFKSRTKTKIE